MLARVRQGGAAALIGSHGREYGWAAAVDLAMNRVPPLAVMAVAHVAAAIASAVTGAGQGASQRRLGRLIPLGTPVEIR